MPKTITLSNIVIDRWAYSTEQEAVTVAYRIVDGQGRTWARLEAVFWKTLPAPAEGMDGQPEPQPANWHQLSAGHAQALANATTTILTKLLEEIA